jgi:hypothetical protein
MSLTTSIAGLFVLPAPIPLHKMSLSSLATVSVEHQTSVYLAVKSGQQSQPSVELTQPSPHATPLGHLKYSFLVAGKLEGGKHWSGTVFSFTLSLQYLLLKIGSQRFLSGWGQHMHYKSAVSPPVLILSCPSGQAVADKQVSAVSLVVSHAGIRVGFRVKLGLAKVE